MLTARRRHYTKATNSLSSAFQHLMSKVKKLFIKLDSLLLYWSVDFGGK